MMKKFRTVAMDVTLALGLLVATGVSAGILPTGVVGSDVFGGATPCTNWGEGMCAGGTAMGCEMGSCLGENQTPITYSNYFQLSTHPCGVDACGYVVTQIHLCVSGT